MRGIAFQLARFMAVGGGATAVHVAVALTAHAAVGLSPLWSNFLAFVVAFTVSYCGHWLWTFGAGARHRLAAPRFLALAVSSFAVNHAIIYVLTGRAGLPLWAALVPVVMVIPVLNFWLSRAWVFQPRRFPA